MVFATFWVRWQGRAWPSVSDRGGGIECFALQLSEHAVGEGAWPFPLAWVLVESTLNSCLLGRTQAKAILVLCSPEAASILLHIF